jgi:DNA-binding MarR family transcriptional regulator
MHQLSKQPYPGLLIAAARRRIGQAVLDRVAGHDLTAQQFWLLVAVLEAPGISQVELAARTRADAPNVSRALTALGDRGLVQMAPHPSDRRRTQVSLTPSGARLARSLRPVAQELRRTMVAGMSQGEVTALCGALRHLIANLDELDRRRVPPAPVRAAVRPRLAAPARRESSRG